MIEIAIALGVASAACFLKAAKHEKNASQLEREIAELQSRADRVSQDLESRRGKR